MDIKQTATLITNDDGFNSKGIDVLKKISKNLFKNVWIVAPLKNQSAKSHSITINKKLKIKKIKLKEYSLSGTPVDCVIIGLYKLISDNKIKPKLLLSGINEGINLGLDLLYSGTVAAAREGSINGIKSIAISVNRNKNKIDYSAVKFFAPKIIESILKKNIPSNIFYNINFPSLPCQLVKGIKVVKTGERKPGKLIYSNIENKEKNFIIPSERKILSTAKSGEDEFELKRHFITLSIHHNKNLYISERDFIKYKKILGKIIEQ